MAAFGAIEEKENAPEFDRFLLSDQLLTDQTWFYFLLEHLVKIMIGWFMWHEIERFPSFFRTWFLISIFNGVQYILHYNSLYFDPVNIFGHELRFSSHVISTFILARAAINET
jgi:hypothetical protein